MAPAMKSVLFGAFGQLPAGGEEGELRGERDERRTGRGDMKPGSRRGRADPDGTDGVDDRHDGAVRGGQLAPVGVPGSADVELPPGAVAEAQIGRIRLGATPGDHAEAGDGVAHLQRPLGRLVADHERPPHPDVGWSRGAHHDLRTNGEAAHVPHPEDGRRPVDGQIGRRLLGAEDDAPGADHQRVAPAALLAVVVEVRVDAHRRQVLVVGQGLQDGLHGKRPAHGVARGALRHEPLVQRAEAVAEIAASDHRPPAVGRRARAGPARRTSAAHRRAAPPAARRRRWASR